MMRKIVILFLMGGVFLFLSAFPIRIDSIISPGNYHRVNTPMTIIVRLRNISVATVTTFPATCSIVGTGGALRYTNTQFIASLAPNDTVRVSFTPWTPTLVEICTLIVRVDTIRRIRVVQIHPYLLIEGFNDPTFPPPGWQSVIIQGIYNWERHTGQGPVWPVEGLGMACYPVFYAPAGSQARLTSPAIDVGTTLNPCTLKFFMFHSSSYPGPPASPYGPDSLKVEYSTDGSSFTRVSAYRRYEPTDNWIEHSLYLGTFSGTIYLGFLAYSEYGTHIYIDYVRLISPSGITEEKLINIPLITMLNPPRPNPITNGLTYLSFALAEPSQVSLKIFDASGRLVKTLVDELKSSGVYSVSWNCKDEYNRKVAEGVYFYTLQTGNYNSTKKLILTK